jgi:hypothetical protein
MPASLYVDAATIAGGNRGPKIISRPKVALTLYFSYHDAAPPTSDMSYSDVVFGDVLLSAGRCYREASRKKGWL